MARFKHWFVNVFWYHYRWPTLGFIAVVLFVGSMIYSFATRKEPDLPYMMIGVGYRPDTVAAEMNALLSEAFGDLNGDETVYNMGDYIDLDFSDTANPQSVQANATRLLGSLTARTCSLLIYTEGVMDVYERQDMIAYLDLTEYGGDSGRVDITSHPAVIELAGNERVYASVVAFENKEAGVLSEQQQQALDAVRLLVSGL